MRCSVNIAKGKNQSLIELKKDIERNGFSWEDYQENLRKEIILQQAYRYLVADQIDITARDIRNFLEEYDKFENNNKEYQLNQIYLSFEGKTDSTTVSSVRERMLLLRKKIVGGTPFAEVASKHSQSSDALNGGAMGWKTAKELPVGFLNPLVAMKPGDISKPIRSDYGYHLINLSQVRDGMDSNELETQYRLRSIIIRKDVQQSSDLLEKLSKGIRKRINEGEKFSALAAQHSQDSQSASRGGDMGWVSLRHLPPEVTDAIAAAKLNQVIGPLSSRYGYHIFEVLETKKVSVSEINRTNFARNKLIKERVNDEIDRWQQSLLSGALVEYKQFKTVTMRQKKVLITMGEPMGIGPELCLAAAEHQFTQPLELCVLGSEKTLAQWKRRRGHTTALVPYQKNQLHQPGTLSLIEVDGYPNSGDAGQAPPFGIPQPESAPWQLAVLEKSVELLKNNQFDCIVNGPVDKAIINLANPLFRGHTEWYGASYQADTVMLLENGTIRVALATTHLPAWPCSQINHPCPA